MTIEVSVPSMLKSCTGGQSLFTLEAETLREAIHKLVEVPYCGCTSTTSGENNAPHVLLYYNEENIKWLESLDVALQKGDRLTVLQAVSGGSFHDKQAAGGEDHGRNQLAAGRRRQQVSR